MIQPIPMSCCPKERFMAAILASRFVYRFVLMTAFIMISLLISYLDLFVKSFISYISVSFKGALRSEELFLIGMLLGKMT